jgi:ketosteroid isomerase-like protein
MSESTTELARALMAMLSRRDEEGLLAATHPEVEWHSFFAELGKDGVYRGRDGTRAYMRDLNESWEIVRADIDDGIEVGDLALLTGRIHYRGRGSGIETETAAGWMLKFRDGKLLQFRAFREPDLAEALEAATLSD